MMMIMRIDNGNKWDGGKVWMVLLEVKSGSM